MKEIYFAGGCFWGVEKTFSSLSGVISATSGYANGKDEKFANYHDVCSGMTDFRETVKVLYDENIISLEHLLFVFFAIINPAQKNRQAMDIGSQYQTGVYYVDNDSKLIAEKIFETEKKYSNRFFVEFKQLENFYDAEEYHQNYLTKNPMGYCHIGIRKINLLKDFDFSSIIYDKNAKEILLEKGLDIQ